MENFLIKLVLLVLFVFSGFTSAEAVIQGWLPPEDYGDADSNEMGMKTEEEEEEEEEEDLGMESRSEYLSMDDIFGDEQVFPFPPGLGN